MNWRGLSMLILAIGRFFGGRVSLALPLLSLGALLALVLLTLPAVAAAQSEPLPKLQLGGEVLTGTVNFKDRRIERLSLPLGERTFVMIQSQGDIDVKGRLLDSRGVVLAENEDVFQKRASVFAFRIERWLDPGDYIVEVEISGGPEGTYSVLADEVVLQGELSYNAPGQPIHIPASARAIPHYYLLHVPEYLRGQPLTIESVSSENPTARLLDSEGAVVADSARKPLSRDFVINSELEPGDYYLSVQPPIRSRNRDYRELDGVELLFTGPMPPIAGFAEDDLDLLLAEGARSPAGEVATLRVELADDAPAREMVTLEVIYSADIPPDTVTIPAGESGADLKVILPPGIGLPGTTLMATLVRAPDAFVDLKQGFGQARLRFVENNVVQGQLELGGEVLQAELRAEGEVQLWQLELTKRTFVVVQSEGNVDVEASLLNSDGRRLARADNFLNSTNFRIERWLDAGNYTVEVRTSEFIEESGLPEGVVAKGTYGILADEIVIQADLNYNVPYRESGFPAGERAHSHYYRIVVPYAAGQRDLRLRQVIESMGSYNLAGRILHSDGRFFVQDFDSGAGNNFYFGGLLSPETLYLSVEPFVPAANGNRNYPDLGQFDLFFGGQYFVGFAADDLNVTVPEGEELTLRLEPLSGQPVRERVQVKVDYSGGRSSEIVTIEPGSNFGLLTFTAPINHAARATLPPLTITVAEVTPSQIAAPNTGFTQAQIRFTDNDPLASAGFAAGSNRTVTEGEIVTLSVELAKGVVATRAVSVPVSYSDGRAPETVTIRSGRNAAELTVSTTDDAVAGGPRELTVTLTAPVNGVLTDGRAVARITVVDDGDPVAMPRFADSSDLTVVEGETAVLRVELAGGVAATRAVSVLAVYSDGRASQRVTISPGSNSAELAVRTADNAIASGPRQLTVTLKAAVNGALTSGTTVARVRVMDDGDPVAALGFADGSDLTVVEGDTATLRVHLAGGVAATRAVSVLAVYSDGRAPQTLTIDVGDNGAELAVRTEDDAVTGGMRELTVTLTSPVNGVLAGIVVARITVVDDGDLVASLGFIADSVLTAVEGETVALRVELAGGAVATRAVSVLLSYSDGRSSERVTIRIGHSAAELKFRVPDDRLARAAPPPLALALSDPQNGTLTSGATVARIRVMDDGDPLAELGFVANADVTVVEGEAATLRVELASGEAATRAVSVLAIYSDGRSSERVTINPGSNGTELAVSTKDDAVAGGARELTVTLTAPVNGVLTSGSTVARIRVMDDGDPIAVLGFADGSDLTVVEGEMAVLRVELAGGVSATRTVSALVSYSDNRDPQIVTISPGRSSAQLAVSAADDAVAGGTRQVTVKLTSPVNGILAGGSDVARITVVDDGDPVAVPRFADGSDLTVVEGETAVLRVELAGGVAATRAVSVLVSYSDGRSSERVAISPGSTGAELAVGTADDAVAGGTRQLTITLTAPVNGVLTGGSAVARITVVDDGDPVAMPRFADGSDLTVVEGETAVLRVELAGGVAATRAVSVLVSYSDGRSSERVTISPGSTGAELAVGTADDTVSGNMRELTVTLTAPVNGVLAGGSAVARIVVVDDGDPVASVGFAAGVTVVEGDTATLQALLAGGAVATRAVSVLAVYSDGRVPETLTIGIGDNGVELAVGTADDVVAGGMRLLTVTLTAPVNGVLTSGSAVARIVVVDDGDPVAAVGFADGSNLTVVEGGTATLRVELAGGVTATRAVSVVAVYSDGRVPETLTINPGNSGAQLAVQTDDDATSGGTRELRVTLTSPVNGVLAGIVVARITVVDDGDLVASLGFVADSELTLVEGETAALRVKLAGGAVATRAVSVLVSYSDGRSSERVTIRIGHSAAELQFKAPDDRLARVAPPPLALTLSDPQNGVLTSGSTVARARVMDDGDPLAELGFGSGADVTVVEGEAATLRVELAGDVAATRAVSVLAIYSDGRSSERVTISPGSNGAQLAIGTADDAVAGGARELTVTLTAPVNGVLTSGSTVARIRVMDDGDPIAVLGFADGSDLTVMEGEMAVLSVELAGGVSATRTVSALVSYSDNRDPQIVTISPGRSSAQLAVSTKDDAVSGGTRRVTVKLTSPVNGVLAGGSTVARITVVDDGDPVAVLSFADGSDLTVVEGETATLRVGLLGGVVATRAVSVLVSYSDGRSSERVTISRGRNGAELAVGTKDDSVAGNTRELTVTLTAPVNGVLAGGGTVARIRVMDDGDPVAALGFGTNSELTVVEGGTATLRVQLAGGVAATRAVSVVAVYSDGRIPETLTINPGNSGAQLAVQTEDDATSGGSRELTVTLTSPVNGVLAAGRAVARLTVADDGDPVAAPRFADVSGLTVVEGRTAKLRVELAGGVVATRAVSVVAVYSDQRSSETVTISRDRRAAELTVRTRDDAVSGGARQLTVTLTSPVNGVLTGGGVVRITVADDGDPVATLGFGSVPSVTVVEGEAATLRVELAGGAVATRAVSALVSYSDNRDPQIVTINPGSSAAELAVSTKDDAVSGGTRQLTVMLTSPMNGVLTDGRAVARIRVVDDGDPVAALGFVANSGVTVVEGEAAMLRVELAGGVRATRTVSALVSYSDNRDAEIVTINPGSNGAQLAIVTKDDSVSGGARELVIKLTSPVNGVLAEGSAVARIAVVDDGDPAALVGFAANSDQTVTEGGTATLRVELAGGVAATRAVIVLVSYSDNRRSEMVMVDAGKNGAELAVSTKDDSVAGNSRELKVVLKAAVNGVLTDGNTVARIKIADDGDPVAQVGFAANSDQTVAEGEMAVLRVELAGGVMATRAVIVLVNYSDVRPSEMVMIPAGKNGAELAVNTKDDNVAGNSRVLTATLKAIMNGVFTVGNTVARIRVADNDPVAAVGFAAGSDLTVAEGETATLRVELAGGVAATRAVSVLAVYSDGRVPETVTIGVGASGMVLAIGTTDDNAAGAPRNLTVKLTSPVNGVLAGGRAVARVTVADDDPVAAVGFAAGSNVTVEARATVTLRVQLAGGAVATRAVSVLALYSDGRRPETVAIAPGSSSAEFSFSAPDDDHAATGSPALRLELASATNAVLAPGLSVARISLGGLPQLMVLTTPSPVIRTVLPPPPPPPPPPSPKPPPEPPPEPQSEPPPEPPVEMMQTAESSPLFGVEIAVTVEDESEEPKRLPGAGGVELGWGALTALLTLALLAVATGTVLLTRRSR